MSFVEDGAEERFALGQYFGTVDQTARYREKFLLGSMGPVC